VIFPTNLDFTEARDSERQWHQLGRMQVCTSLQTDNHASTAPLSFLQAFLLLNQQRQSTEGSQFVGIVQNNLVSWLVQRNHYDLVHAAVV